MASNMKLKSLDILTKAQIVMSTSVSESVAKKFKKLIQEDKEGKFNLEKKKAALAGLHIHSIKPEDLDSTNQETYLNFIKAKDIDAYIANNELEKQQAKEKIEKSNAQAVANQEIARLAIHGYLESENKQRRDKYERMIAAYKARKEKWVKEQISHKQRRAIWRLLGYIAVVAIACLGSLWEFNASISVLFTLFFVIIPFIRPIWNHYNLVQDFKFLMFKNVWKDEVNQKELAYSKIEARPKLELMTLDEAERKFKMNSID